MSRAGDSSSADAQEGDGCRCAGRGTKSLRQKVGVAARDWRHQRFPQEVFWEKPTKLNLR